MRSGQDFSDEAPVIEDLNPLFDSIMNAMRAAQLKKPRRFVVDKSGSEFESEKYQSIYSPFGLPPLWAHWWMAKTAPVRRKIAAQLQRWSWKLQGWARKIA